MCKPRNQVILPTARNGAACVLVSLHLELLLQPVRWISPHRATDATTRTHVGNAATPGMASATSPGKSAQRQPSSPNRRSAVVTSTAHCTNGTNSVPPDTTSEAAATRKARTNRVFEGPAP